MPRYETRRYNAEYIRHDAATIASEVVLKGKSGGWSGDTESVEAIKEILSPMNIHYVDDFHGEWAFSA